MHDSDTSKGRVAVASCCIGGWLVGYAKSPNFRNAKGLSSDNALGVLSHHSHFYIDWSDSTLFCRKPNTVQVGYVTGDNTLGK